MCVGVQQLPLAAPSPRHHSLWVYMHIPPVTAVRRHIWWNFCPSSYTHRHARGAPPSARSAIPSPTFLNSASNPVLPLAPTTHQLLHQNSSVTMATVSSGTSPRVRHLLLLTTRKLMSAMVLFKSPWRRPRVVRKPLFFNKSSCLYGLKINSLAFLHNCARNI